MVSSLKSATKTTKDEHSEDTPKTNLKRKRTPGKEKVWTLFCYVKILMIKAMIESFCGVVLEWSFCSCMVFVLDFCSVIKYFAEYFLMEYWFGEIILINVLTIAKEVISFKFMWAPLFLNTSCIFLCCSSLFLLIYSVFIFLLSLIADLLTVVSGAWYKEKWSKTCWKAG